MVSGAILALGASGDHLVESFLLQDEARTQKVTERLHTLEEVNNNVKLLGEMLLHYSKEESSEADKELMKVAPLETPLRVRWALTEESAGQLGAGAGPPLDRS